MRLVLFSALFAIGFRACMMGGAFVMRGMVRIGVSLITLCCSSRTLCCYALTLCSVRGVSIDGGGLSMVWRLDCSNLRRRHLFDVVAAMAMESRSSSMRALRC